MKQFLFILFVFASPILWADPRQTLLAFKHRPTVSEIKAAVDGNFEGPNPFGTPTANLQTTIMLNAPAAIAVFEKIFPGATFAPLGRDAAFLGDIIDAFYLSIGQERVIRVNASGASRTNDQDLFQFMKGLGVNIDTKAQQTPFIMFDQTNFNSSSQSFTYLRSIYAACKQMNCDPSELIERFNFINTGATRNMYPNNIVTPTTNIPQFLNQLKTQIKTGQAAAPSALLSVSVDSGLTYTAEYHDTFSQFTKQPDGSVTTNPGSMKPDSTRLQILADVWETIKTVSSPQFKKAVEAEAQFFGYSFPHTLVVDSKERDQIRTATVPVEKLSELLEIQLMNRLEYRMELPLNAQQLWSAIQIDTKINVNNPNLDDHFLAIKLAAKAFQAGKIDEDTMMSAMIYLMNQVEISQAHSELLIKMANFLRSNEKLFSFFSRQMLPKALKNQNNLGVYLAKMNLLNDLMKRIPFKTALENAYAQQFTTFEKNIKAEFTKRLSSAELIQKIQSETNTLARVSPTEAWTMALNLTLDGYNRRLIDRSGLTTIMSQVLNTFNLQNHYIVESFATQIRKSSHATEIFLGPLWDTIRKSRSMIPKYQTVYSQITGKSDAVLYKKYFSDLADDYLRGKVAPDQWANNFSSEINNIPLQPNEKTKLWTAALLAVEDLERKKEISKEQIAVIFLTSMNTQNLTMAHVLEEYRNLLINNSFYQSLWFNEVVEMQSLANWNRNNYHQVDVFTFGRTDSESKHSLLMRQIEMTSERVRTQMDLHQSGSNFWNWTLQAFNPILNMDRLEGQIALLNIAFEGNKRRVFDENTIAMAIQSYMAYLDTTQPQVITRFLELVQQNKIVKRIFLKTAFEKVATFQNGWGNYFKKYADLYIAIHHRDLKTFLSDVLVYRHNSQKNQLTGSNFQSNMVSIINALQGYSPQNMQDLWITAMNLAFTDLKSGLLNIKETSDFITYALQLSFSADPLWQEQIERLIKSDDLFSNFWKNDYYEHLHGQFSQSAPVLKVYQSISEKVSNIDSTTYLSGHLSKSLGKSLDKVKADPSFIQKWMISTYDPSTGPVPILSVLEKAHNEHELSSEAYDLAFLTLTAQVLNSSTEQNQFAKFFIDHLKKVYPSSDRWVDHLIHATLSTKDTSTLKSIEQFITRYTPDEKSHFYRELSKQAQVIIPQSTVSATGQNLLFWIGFISNLSDQEIYKSFVLDLASVYFQRANESRLEMTDRQKLFQIIWAHGNLRSPKLIELQLWQDMAEYELTYSLNNSNIKAPQKQEMFTFYTDNIEKRLFNGKNSPTVDELFNHLHFPAANFGQSNQDGVLQSWNATAIASWFTRLMNLANHGDQAKRDLLIKYAKSISNARRHSLLLASDFEILFEPILSFWIDEDLEFHRQIVELYESDGEFRELWKLTRKNQALNPQVLEKMNTIDAQVPGFCKLALKRLFN